MFWLQTIISTQTMTDNIIALCTKHLSSLDESFMLVFPEELRNSNGVIYYHFSLNLHAAAYLLYQRNQHLNMDRELYYILCYLITWGASFRWDEFRAKFSYRISYENLKNGTNEFPCRLDSLGERIPAGMDRFDAESNTEFMLRTGNRESCLLTIELERLIATSPLDSATITAYLRKGPDKQFKQFLRRSILEESLHKRSSTLREMIGTIILYGLYDPDNYVDADSSEDEDEDEVMVLLLDCKPFYGAHQPVMLITGWDPFGNFDQEITYAVLATEYIGLPLPESILIPMWSYASTFWHFSVAPFWQLNRCAQAPTYLIIIYNRLGYYETSKILLYSRLFDGDRNEKADLFPDGFAVKMLGIQIQVELFVKRFILWDFYHL